MELKTLKLFNTEIEAELLRTYLETCQIESFIFGNILANTYNLFNNTSGGVAIKVKVEDWDLAVIALDNYYK